MKKKEITDYINKRSSDQLIAKDIEQIDHNRAICHSCGKKILKGTPIWRGHYRGPYSSDAFINLCPFCVCAMGRYILKSYLKCLKQILEQKVVDAI